MYINSSLTVLVSVWNKQILWEHHTEGMKTVWNYLCIVIFVPPTHTKIFFPLILLFKCLCHTVKRELMARGLKTWTQAAAAEARTAWKQRVRTQPNSPFRGDFNGQMTMIRFTLNQVQFYLLNMTFNLNNVYIEWFIVQEHPYLASSSLVLRKFNMGTKASGSLSINIYFEKQ